MSISALIDLASVAGVYSHLQGDGCEGYVTSHVTKFQQSVSPDPIGGFECNGDVSPIIVAAT
jgi:hypothetical protein